MPVGLLQLGYTQGHQEEGYLAEPHVSLMLLSNNKSTQCCALNIRFAFFARQPNNKIPHNSQSFSVIDQRDISPLENCLKIAMISLVTLNANLLILDFIIPDDDEKSLRFSRF
jgi:hypothetical protein